MATKKEKVVKKIHGLMTKWGVTPDELEEFGKDLDIELEDTDFEDDQLEETVEGEIEKEKETEEPETEKEVETESEETVEEETEEPIKLDEVPTQEEPEQPVEPVEVEKPTATPEQVKELETAVEGLRAKLDSLYDSLSKAGVLMVEETPIGVDTSTAPANGEEETFDDVLGELNKGRRY